MKSLRRSFNAVYSMKRDKIADVIKGFLSLVACQETDVLILALDAFGELNFDFIDCVLFGYHAVKGITVATFDKKLLKLMSNGIR